MTKTGASVGLVFAIAAAFGLSGTATRAAKPTVDPDWSCAITFADRQGDVIHSDGNNGISTYTAGVDLVTCYIHPDGTAALAQNLHFQTGVDRRGVRRRTLHIEGQTYGGPELKQMMQTLHVGDTIPMFTDKPTALMATW